jgi:hypothetical protein
MTGLNILFFTRGWQEMQPKTRTCTRYRRTKSSFYLGLAGVAARASTIGKTGLNILFVTGKRCCPKHEQALGIAGQNLLFTWGWQELQHVDLYRHRLALVFSTLQQG